jgi:arginine deiminase
MPRVNVTSEIGPLRAVLVHTPGNELLAVTPGTREDYLYDDIINVESARREHQRMVAVLQRFAEVHEVRQLLAEVLERREARDFLIGRTLEVVPSDALARQLSELPTAQLVTTLIEGAIEECGRSDGR